MSLKPSDIPSHRCTELESGFSQTQNLAESLAMDLANLAESTFPHLGISADLTARILQSYDSKSGITRRMAYFGQHLADHHVQNLRDNPIHLAIQHPSDTVRGWAAYGLNISMQSLPLEEQIAAMHPLADDPHFGVREWAWMALRPALLMDIPLAIHLLQPWTLMESANLRRFAVEVLRPRGVWCSHAPMLKQTPALGLPLLSPLNRDPSRYVQDSVANWLNDASKSQPDWVRKICNIWQQENPSDPITQRICKRALRSVQSSP